MNATTRLTTGEYWDSGYLNHDSSPLRIDDFRALHDRRIIEAIEGVGLAERQVLEVGAGNSALLTYLARAHHGAATFAGLDYSENGCRLLASRAKNEGVAVEVIHQDLFAPSPDVAGRFEVIYSLGVVEHFSDLTSVLCAMRRLLVPGGRMITIIPNMAGVLGTLTRRFNRRVYDLHVPHNLHTFTSGHLGAGLAVERAGYLCSTNFGVLSSCFGGPTERGWITYTWLSRVSKAFWFVEGKIGDFPHTASFSPYLYVVSSSGE